LAKRVENVEVFTAPWFGWTPDLPAHIIGWKGFRDGSGLVPKSLGGHGLFLTTDDGFIRVDEDRMTYGGATILTANRALMIGPVALTWGGTIPGNGVMGAVTMLAQFTDANGLPQRLAIISGDEGGAGFTDCLVANLNPANDQWREIDSDLDIALADIPDANREALWDSAPFGFGCPARTDSGAAAANITEPCIVFCSADEDGPVDPVYVFPNDAGIAGLLYDELIQDPAITPAPGFRATSVEAFGGRMHFLGTFEGAETYRRHRWSAVGTAYPNEAIVGSGYLDFDADFDRRGLRIESMENHLVLYFEDGVAFQVPTNFYADAYRPRIVSKTRGLLGTHAMCAISPHLHFGIFNDGWWSLDSSGRWSKLGRLVLEETKGKAHELSKWEDTFYQDLDWDNKHRIVCVYDKFRQLVRIAYTSVNETDNFKILNYHWPTDSCWPGRVGNPVTMWGMYDVQSAAGTTWGGMGLVLTWGTVLGSWGLYGPEFVEETVVHGGLNGLVYARDFNTITHDGGTPTFTYRTHEISRNESPWLDQTFHRFGLEYMSATGSSANVTPFMDNLSVFQTEPLSLGEGLPGQMHTAHAPFRMRGTHHGFWLTGSAPVLIRSMVTEMQLHGSLDREGQV
jgi:hypothetical protein